MDILVTGGVGALAVAVGYLVLRARGGGASRSLAAKKVAEAEAAVLSGNRTLALALLEKAQELDQSSVRIHHGLASVLFDERRFADAERHLAWIHEQGRGSEATHRLAVLCALMQDDPARAVAAARAGLEDEASSAGLRELLGEAARRVYDRELGSGPSDPQHAAHAALGRVLQGDVLRQFVSFGEKLEEHLDEAPLIEQVPGVADLVRTAVAAMTELGRDMRPVRAVVSCTTGETVLAEIEDADPTTHATLEVLRDGRIEFLPLRELRAIRFGPPALWRPAELTLKDGKTASVHVPLLYRHTSSTTHPILRTGSGTVWRALTADVELPLGVRQYRAEDQAIGLDSITHIEFPAA
ncbi:MAG: type VI secretion system accessory protein TagJ [Planctomycetota bacterium]